MKTRKVDKIRECDICGKIGEVYYDMPTANGQWGNLCEECRQKQPYTTLGTKFVLRDMKLPSAEGILRGIEYSTLEEAFEGDREIKCPNCGELRLVEPDADYVFECEGCDTKVKVPCLF